MWEFVSHQSPIYRRNKEAIGRTGPRHNAHDGPVKRGTLETLWEMARPPSMRGDWARRADCQSYQLKRTPRDPTDLSRSGASDGGKDPRSANKAIPTPLQGPTPSPLRARANCNVYTGRPAPERSNEEMDTRQPPTANANSSHPYQAARVLLAKKMTQGKGVVTTPTPHC
jgi:hypothetical protein